MPLHRNLGGGVQGARSYLGEEGKAQAGLVGQQRTHELDLKIAHQQLHEIHL
jgi:hypothetical protein